VRTTTRNKNQIINLVTTVTWLSFPYWFRDCSACTIFSERLVKFTQVQRKFSQSWYLS